MISDPGLLTDLRLSFLLISHLKLTNHVTLNLAAYETNEYLGGYFLYYSLQQLRAFLNSIHERLQDNIIKNILDVDIIQGDFEKHDDGDVNPWAIVAGGLGAVGAVGGPAAPVAGIVAGVAGVIWRNDKLRGGGDGRWPRACSACQVGLRTGQKRD